MGIFGAIMGAMGGMVGEQLFPYYQNTALRMGAYDLEREAKDEENKLPYRAVYLLALMRKSEYSACEIYKRDKTRFENAFNQLYNYRKFKPEIDTFRRKVSSGSDW